MLAGTAVAQDAETLATAAMAMVSDEKHAWVLLRHHLDVDIVVVSFAGLSGAPEATDDLDNFLNFVDLAASLSPSVSVHDINPFFNRTSFVTAKGTFALDAQGALYTRPTPYICFSNKRACGFVLFPNDDQQIQA